MRTSVLKWLLGSELMWVARLRALDENERKTSLAQHHVLKQVQFFYFDNEKGRRAIHLR